MYTKLIYHALLSTLRHAMTVFQREYRKGQGLQQRRGKDRANIYCEAIENRHILSIYSTFETLQTSLAVLSLIFSCLKTICFGFHEQIIRGLTTAHSRPADWQLLIYV